MKTSIFLGTVAAATLMAGAGMADTLADVKARGELNCGVNTGLVGFAAPDANGNWTGFDVDICKAVAAAVLGDPSKVKYVPTTGQTRFTALSSGGFDALPHNGAVITLLTVCKITHREAYGDIFIVACAIPMLALAVLIVLTNLLGSF